MSRDSATAMSASAKFPCLQVPPFDLRLPGRPLACYCIYHLQEPLTFCIGVYLCYGLGSRGLALARLSGGAQVPATHAAGGGSGSAKRGSALGGGDAVPGGACAHGAGTSGRLGARVCGE